MADVEMTDAGPSAIPAAKSSKAGPGGGDLDGKKRFEVKKVSTSREPDRHLRLLVL